MFIDTYHSRMGFAPGALTLCGQTVRQLDWSTTSRHSDEAIWEQMTALQDQQATLNQEAFCDLLQTVETLAHLNIRTDVNTLEIQPHSPPCVTLTLPSNETLSFRATPIFAPAANDTLQVLSVALHFLSCSTLPAAERKLAKAKLLGIATNL